MFRFAPVVLRLVIARSKAYFAILLLALLVTTFRAVTLSPFWETASLPEYRSSVFSLTMTRSIQENLLSMNGRFFTGLMFA